MKVAALTPHFTIEASPVAEASEAQRTASKLHLKVVKPEEPTANSGGQALDQETREGLKRLSEFLQEQKRKRANEEVQQVAKELEDRRKQRALQQYQDLQEARDPSSDQGKLINTYL